MEWVYWFCAIVGGSVLAIQFLLVAIGIGGMEDADSSGDVGGDIGDVGDVGDIDTTGDFGGDAEIPDAGQTAVTTNWLFGIISLKTLVAGATFFGLIGLGMKEAGYEGPLRHLSAIGAGLVAIFIVNWLTQSMARFNADGTFRIEQSVGSTGRVYLSVPPTKSGSGKIHVSVHGRMVELKAITSGETVPTGMTAVVVGVVTNDTVEIRPVGSLETTTAS
ncbi:MAG: hypothetical protein ACFCD0_17670 [Gemmataceae bacterium]